MIHENLAELIGHTPLLALNRLFKGQPARVVAKLESCNPYSLKDRPMLYCISQAEQRGELKPGATLVEATSGNTGIALAFLGRIKGYKVVLCMSEIQSRERRQVLKSLGAELILTPAAGGTAAAKAKAIEIAAERGGFQINQHGNPDNALAHEKTTGEEIWRDTDGAVDIFVAGLGTGGTLSGTSRTLKKYNPKIRIIGVEPKEAPVISKGRFKPHKIMGLAPGFVPDVYDPTCVDDILTVSQDQAFAMCRSLATKEGLLAGISSGAVAAAAGALAAKEENTGKLIVCIFADSGERYLSVEGLFDDAEPTTPV